MIKTKKSLILPILMVLTLAFGCVKIGNKPTNSNSNVSTVVPTTSPTQSTSSPTVTVTTSIPSSDVQTEFRYGDYVKYVDESKNESLLKNDISQLHNEIVTKYDDIFVSTYQEGLLDFFNIEKEIKLNINITTEELNLLNKDYNDNNKESYRICDLDIILDGIQFHYEDVGIRQKGNTSKGNVINEDGSINLKHYKLSLSETFDDEFRDNPLVWMDTDALLYREGRTFFGLEKFFIRTNRNNDSTYIKEYYAYEMYRANGILAPHSNPMVVTMTIDGNSQDLGVYLGVEEVDKSFIKRNLTQTALGGDLYKLGWGSGTPATLDNTDASLFGVEKQLAATQGFYQNQYTYDLKTNKKTSTHQNIKNFISNINSYSSDTFNEFMNEYMLYDYTINFMAISYLLGDPDDLRGNFNNTYIYFMADTNKAIFIPTDHDRALGSTGGGGNPTTNHGALTKPFDNSTGYYGVNDKAFWTKSILNGGNSTIRENYLAKVIEIASSKWMTIDNFNYYYDHAVNNYSDNVALGDKINGSMLEFSLIEDDDLTSEWNLSIEVYFNTKKNTVLNYEITNPSEYYFRGIANDWNGISDDYNLEIIDGIPTIKIYLEANQAFKIANSDWSSSFDYDSLVDNTGFTSEGSHKNIMAQESGYYIIKIIGYNTDSMSLSIIKE